MQTIATCCLDLALIQPQRAKPRARRSTTPFGPEFDIHVCRRGRHWHLARQSATRNPVFDIGPLPSYNAGLPGRFVVSGRWFGSVIVSRMIEMVVVMTIAVVRNCGPECRGSPGSEPLRCGNRKRCGFVVKRWNCSRVAGFGRRRLRTDPRRIRRRGRHDTAFHGPQSRSSGSDQQRANNQ